MKTWELVNMVGIFYTFECKGYELKVTAKSIDDALIKFYMLLDRENNTVDVSGWDE